MLGGERQYLGDFLLAFDKARLFGLLLVNSLHALVLVLEEARQATRPAGAADPVQLPHLRLQVVRQLLHIELLLFAKLENGLRLQQQLEGSLPSRIGNRRCTRGCGSGNTCLLFCSGFHKLKDGCITEFFISMAYSLMALENRLNESCMPVSSSDKLEIALLSSMYSVSISKHQPRHLDKDLPWLRLRIR